MTYKITEEDNISTIFLDGEIDMDKTEEVKKLSFQKSTLVKKLF